MIPSPIRKVLSLIQRHQVRALLMGGQACVLYGAAEFSRDIDFVILASEKNKKSLQGLLDELDAGVIAVPPFSLEYLERGHAVHFRCATPEAAGLRVDIMTKLRGVDEFETLWQRRTTISEADGTEYQLMSLPDLVKAKKTQRDKDWPMIRRLVEADYLAGLHEATPEQVRFWLLELRSPNVLIEMATVHLDWSKSLCNLRPLLRFAIARDQSALSEALFSEEKAEREADQQYWRPLKAELEKLRRDRLKP